MSAAPATLPADQGTIPSAIASLVRSWDHYLAVLRHSAALARSKDPQTMRAAQRFIRVWAHKGASSPELVPLILALVPVKHCLGCGRPFLAEQTRRRHCDDNCRHRWSWQAPQARGRAACSA